MSESYVCLLKYKSLVVRWLIACYLFSARDNRKCLLIVFIVRIFVCTSFEHLIKKVPSGDMKPGKKFSWQARIERKVLIDVPSIQTRN